jgi:hypothetical protein
MCVARNARHVTASLELTDRVAVPIHCRAVADAATAKLNAELETLDASALAVPEVREVVGLLRDTIVRVRAYDGLVFNHDAGIKPFRDLLQSIDALATTAATLVGALRERELADRVGEQIAQEVTRATDGARTVLSTTQAP